MFGGIIILKLHKKLMTIILLGLTAISLAACSSVDDWSLSLKSKIGQLPLIVSTYDANGQKIDQIKAKSVHIHTDREMSKTDSSGNEKSSVIDVDYGKHRMTHVGSTLIAYEGLTNYEDKFTKHVNIAVKFALLTIIRKNTTKISIKKGTSISMFLFFLPVFIVLLISTATVSIYLGINSGACISNCIEQLVVMMNERDSRFKMI